MKYLSIPRSIYLEDSSAVIAFPRERNLNNCLEILFFLILVSAFWYEADRICIDTIEKFAALGGFSTNRDNLVAQVKKVRIHPPSASRILLPDGRNLAYHEQGVPASRARYSLIAPHSFLSSRLAGKTNNI